MFTCPYGNLVNTFWKTQLNNCPRYSFRVGKVGQVWVQEQRNTSLQYIRICLQLEKDHNNDCTPVSGNWKGELEENKQNYCGKCYPCSWIEHTQKFLQISFIKLGVALLAFLIAAKVRNEICIAVVASSEEIVMVISEPSFLWILILLSFTEFFSSKASNEIKVNHPGCLSSFKYPPNPIDRVKSQVQSSQVKSPSSNKKHYHAY